MNVWRSGRTAQALAWDALRASLPRPMPLVGAMPGMPSRPRGAGHTSSGDLVTLLLRVTEAMGSARGGSTAARPAASCGASHCGARLGAMKAAAFAIAQESRTARRNIAEDPRALESGRLGGRSVGGWRARKWRCLAGYKNKRKIYVDHGSLRFSRTLLCTLHLPSLCNQVYPPLLQKFGILSNSASRPRRGDGADFSSHQTIGYIRYRN